MMLLTMTAQTAWATITGSGSSTDPYVINTEDDWNTAAANNTYWYNGVYVELGSDLVTLLGDGWQVSDGNVVPKMNASIEKTIVNPMFAGVTIDKTHRDVISTDGTISFKGTYAPIVWETENKSILFLGTNNTLYYPLPDLTDAQNPKYPHLNAFRAYFQLGDGTNAPQITAINLNFDSGVETGISEMRNEELGMRNGNEEMRNGSAWYTLSGTRLDSKPTQPGLYINNGRKIVVK